MQFYITKHIVGLSFLSKICIFPVGWDTERKMLMT